jgi:hypothetical protein
MRLKFTEPMASRQPLLGPPLKGLEGAMVRRVGKFRRARESKRVGKFVRVAVA